MFIDIKKHKLTKRAILGVVLLVFILSSFMQIVGPTAEYAFAKEADDSSKDPDEWFPSTRARRWAMLNAVHLCINNAGAPKNEWRADYDTQSVDGLMEEGDVQGGNWFVSSHRMAGSHLAPGVDVYSRSSCNELVVATASLYSLTPLEMFCAMGGQRLDGSPCVESQTEARLKALNSNARLPAQSIQRVWGTPNLPGFMGEAAAYTIGLANLKGAFGCKLTEGGDGTGDFGYKIRVVDDKGKITTQNFTGEKHDKKLLIYTRTDLTEVETTCGALASDIDKYADDFSKWQKKHLESPDNNSNTPDSEVTGTTCALQGTGWFFCPIARSIVNFVDFTFKVMEFFLQVPPFNMTLNSGNGLYTAWSIMRNIANAVFVVVFILVIYSQIVGGGKR